jgi:hypothetical protein
VTRTLAKQARQHDGDENSDDVLDRHHALQRGCDIDMEGAQTGPNRQGSTAKHRRTQPAWDGVNIVAMEGRPQPKDSIVYVLNGQIAGGVVRFAKKQAGWYDVRMNVQGNGQSAGCLELLLASDMKGETWEFGTVQTYEEHGGGHKNLQRASAERLFKRSKKRGRIEQPCCDNTSTEVQPRVYTGASDVCAGEGLFAATNLQQGDVVVAMVSPTKVTREAGEAYMQRFGVPTDSVVDYERSGKVMTYYDESWTNADTRPYWHYLNHGRPGNTRPRVRANAYEWVASGPILAGEEMTFDYGEPDPSWSRDSSVCTAICTCTADGDMGISSGGSVLMVLAASCSRSRRARRSCWRESGRRRWGRCLIRLALTAIARRTQNQMEACLVVSERVKIH